MVFRDRQDAGRQLAVLMRSYRGLRPIVLALPRGGVPVGYEIACALDAPLDVFVARKLGAPGQPELAIGAIAPGGVRVLDPKALQWLALSEEELAQITARETAEMEQRQRRFRGDAPLPNLQGRTVILVDDGLATGMTARAAIQAIRRQQPLRLALAVPVAAPESAAALRPLVDDLICLSLPQDFRAVGLWYADFGQVSDEEVLDLLERARNRAAAGESRGDPALSRRETASAEPPEEAVVRRSVQVIAGGVPLSGDLEIPAGARSLVVFAHGSGSSRHSPRNRYVAQTLHRAGLATLLFDLLTPEEEALDQETRHLRFDIRLLADRLLGATEWLRQQPATRNLRIGYFGASTGAAAALIAASERPELIGAVVSRGGRPDLADAALPDVKAPTLLIVGGEDSPVIPLNRQALDRLGVAEKRLEIVPGATHLFEEPGALAEVARLSANWFRRYLDRANAPMEWLLAG